MQEELNQDELVELEEEDTMCYRCSGTGMGMYEGSRCTTCKGSGEQINKNKLVW